VCGEHFHGFGDDLGVFVGVDVDDFAPAHAHDVDAVVLIR
jgi:hypothetical protein